MFLLVRSERKKCFRTTRLFLLNVTLSLSTVVYAGFFPSSSSGYLFITGRYHSSSHRAGVLRAYIDGVDGISRGSPNNVFDGCDDEVMLTNASERITLPRSLPNGGKISLVGSGPGDPELLTIAAHRLITDPFVMVIADRLVSPEILQLVKGDCKIARKLPGCAEEAQEEIYSWVKEGLDAGKHVVRLKIGDPFVFGRGGEEVIKFREYGLDAAIIPGVSAALSAPLLASIPVTHRGVSNQVVICTGYGRNGSSPDLIKYHKEQTIVFLMAVGRLKELCQNLIELAGYPSTTPVAIIEKAGCPQQRVVVGNMQTIAFMAEVYDVKPPSTIVVGEVVTVLLAKDECTGESVAGLIHSCLSNQRVLP